MYTIARYTNRYWAVYAPGGELVAVTVYKIGARTVAELLNRLSRPARHPASG